jgi:hypothetical protein
MFKKINLLKRNVSLTNKSSLNVKYMYWYKENDNSYVCSKGVTTMITPEER